MSSIETENPGPMTTAGTKPPKLIIIVMGVSGTGKSTLMYGLSRALGFPACDGDDLHTQENKDKMGRGEPLGDADRLPWLKTVRSKGLEFISSGAGGAVLACSALKKSYRQILRGEVEPGSDVQTYFVWLNGEKSDLEARMVRRAQIEGHYMKANMLDSQFAALEPPEGEADVVAVSFKDEEDPSKTQGAKDQQLKEALEGLERLAGQPLS